MPRKAVQQKVFYVPTQKITVPNEIRCCRCDVVKNKAAFSETRLRELQDYMSNRTGRFDAKITKYIPCNGCSNTSRTELQCHKCDVWQGINAFSKTQRRRGDEALCLKCAEKQNESDSDSEDGYESDDNPYFSDDDEEGNDFVTVTEQSNKSSAGGVRVPNSGATVYAGRTNTDHTTSAKSIQSSTSDDGW